MREPRLELSVWVASDPNSGVLCVALSRREAEGEMKAHLEKCRTARFMHNLDLLPGHKKARMPLPGKITRLTLPGAGYDALYPEGR
jgi:hypothetical protein